MSWAGFLSELDALDISSGPAASYVRGQVITVGVREGQSANSIVNGLSALGVGVRRQQALALIREETDRQAAGATAAQLDLTQPIDELLSATPPPNFTGQYIHQVAITFRTRDEEGNYMLNSITRGIKAATVLTPEEAVNAALQIVTDNPEPTEDSPPISPDSILSAELSGAWYATSSPSIPTFGGGGGPGA